MRLQKKELRLNRRKKKIPKFDVITQAKQIWEVLRKQSSNVGVRKEQITKLYAILKGNLKEVFLTLMFYKYSFELICIINRNY